MANNNSNVDMDLQIYPVDGNKEDYIIKTREELINQLESLKQEARLNTKPFKEPIFYKDYNALSVAINVLKKIYKME